MVFFANYRLLHSFAEYESFLDQANSGAAIPNERIGCSGFPTRNNLVPTLRAAKKSRLLGLCLFHFRTWEGDDTEILCQELQDATHLEELTLLGEKQKQTSFRAAVALGSLIKLNKSLLALSLRVPQADTSFLSEALPANSTLQHLELRCPLPEEGVSGLGYGLRGNTSLEVLCLNSCRIDDVGAMGLAQAITINVNLRTLELHHNEIRDKGGIALARNLRSDTALRSLNLSWNRITTRGAQAFLDVLGASGNRTLRSLQLFDNPIDAEELKDVDQVLEVNTILEKLSLFRIQHGQDRVSFYATPKGRLQAQVDAVLKQRLQKRRIARFKAFEGAQGSDATTPWLRSKLMVVGRGAAGKTNTVRSLLGLPFNPEWDSTIGITLTEVATKSGKHWNKDKHTDFASSFVHRLAAENFEEPQHFPQQSKEKTSHTKPVKKKWKWFNRASHTTHNQISFTAVVSDLALSISDASLSMTKHEESSFKYNEEMFLAQEDSKDAIRMSVWDYGGQTVFYTLHHLFLTQYGVYLIVFNMCKLEQNPKEASEYLLFWLNSIKLHAPNAPVLLVGTFLDQLDTITPDEKTNPKSQLQKISTILNKLCVGFDQVCSFEDSVFCPTSNKDKSGIQTLRSVIEQETRKADFVQTPVSLKWVRALDILANSKDAWMQVAALKVELKSIGIDGDNEIDRMLRLFHELGVVLYFSSSVRLKEVIIGKPEWLLEQLIMVIRDKDIHGYDEMKLEEMRLTKDAEYFLTDGIISRDLLEVLWDREHVDYLVELMRHLLLLSDWGFSENELYLIPSMLSSREVKSISGIKFYLAFAFLPQGVFERICCLCVGYSTSVTPTTSPKLCQDKCIVDLGSRGLLQVEVPEHNKVGVMLSEEAEAGWVVDFFLSMMRRIQDDFMHGGLEWKVWVQNGTEFLSHEDAEKQKLKPWVRMKEEVNNAAIEKFLDM